MADLLTTFGPILVAALTARFGIYSYRNQKETDRWVELRNRRMKDYDSYLAAYYHYRMWDEVDKAKTDQAALDYQDAYRNLFQVASDRALIAATDFNEFAWRGNTSLTGVEYEAKVRDLYATLILEMRRDAFEETRLPKDLVERRLPWVFDRGLRGCLRSPNRLLEHASRDHQEPFSQPFLAVFASQKKPSVAYTDPSQTPSHSGLHK
jgi:hypothetical protein